MSPEDTGNCVLKAGKGGGVETATGAQMAGKSVGIRNWMGERNDGSKTEKAVTGSARAENGVIAIGAQDRLRKTPLW